MQTIHSLPCRVAHLIKTVLILLVLLPLQSVGVMAGNITREWIEQHYRKREVMIPMRDGIHLYTAIYEPVKGQGRHPVIMQRTPYGCYPYGKELNGSLWNGMAAFAEKGYIIVFQDVRGRRMSEGDFVNVRPVSFRKGAPADDASDAYDTADWLVRHTECNGNIGLTGNSYLGYYALVSALCAHPAIKAVCPQAPIGDWFMGDDTHHNGVLMLTDAFRFLSGFHRPRKGPSVSDSPYKAYYEGNERDFFLQKATLRNVLQVLGDSIGFWNDMAAHPDYDSWWQERSYRHLLGRTKAAVMIVGGLFDAEDLYGTWNAYYGLKHSRNGSLFLLMGPWAHGGWHSRKANTLGGIRFSDQDLGTTFSDMQQAFFDHYLLGKGSFPDKTPAATVFFTGENRWRTFTEWPAKAVKRQSLYLNRQGTLSSDPPAERKSCTQYTSDPADPVPYTATQAPHRKAAYMVEDQRFAGGRADVLSFQTGILQHDVTIGGEITADLWVSLTTTDADFVVKLVDKYPDDATAMGGYELPVRADIMRGRYRESFARPKPFRPRQPQRVTFRMPDAAHTFRKGHRIKVYIQSSWFPLAEMNPQQFVNPWTCGKDDFVPTSVTVYHQKNKASRLLLPVIK